MANSNFRKYLGDGLLIVFSVLFALFINSLAEKHSTKNKKKIALDGIRKELLKNKEILTVWNSDHKLLSSTLDSLIKGEKDSLIIELKKHDYFKFGLLNDNQTLIQDMVSNTAWETAKSTGIVGEFSFETVQTLTTAYSIQDEVTNRSLRSILELYFDRESNDIKNLQSTLNQFDLQFKNLVGQEYGLLHLYDQGIGELNQLN